MIFRSHNICNESFPWLFIIGHVGENDIPKQTHNVSEQHLILQRHHPKIDRCGDGPDHPVDFECLPNLFLVASYTFFEPLCAWVLNQGVDHEESGEDDRREDQLIDGH